MKPVLVTVARTLGLGLAYLGAFFYPPALEAVTRWRDEHDRRSAAPR